MTDSINAGQYGFGWWDTICLPSQQMILNGASDPSRESATGYLLFPVSGTKIIVAGCLMPAGWIEGSKVWVDARWTKITPVASPQVRTGNVKWSLRYRYAAPGSALSAYGTAYKSATVSTDTPDTDTDDKILITKLSSATLTNGTIGTFLQLELSRIPAADSPDIDTYPESARLISIDVHYQKNQPGSHLPYSKFDAAHPATTRYNV